MLPVSRLRACVFGTPFTPLPQVDLGHDANRTGASMRQVYLLASAGFVATAVAFGPARMGFGLFLPTFREAFALSTTMAGLVASLAFSAFLIALPLTAWLGGRVGQRVPIVAGALSAMIGFWVVASASDVGELALGIALAGASAGLCWAPFNDAAERVVPEADRPGALSAVSTGTTVGVAGAGALFLAVTLGSLDWRVPWVVFGVMALVAALMALYGVPGGRTTPNPGTAGQPKLFRRNVISLYVVAMCFGASNSVYLSFAADHVVAGGGLPGITEQSAAAVIFLGYGLCGLVGLATGRLEAWLGLNVLIATIFSAFTASLALVAIFPGVWSAVVVSAALHGGAVMTISAVLAFWSLRLFPGRGSTGFTIALIGVALASVIGSATAGLLADATSLATALLATSAAPLIAAIIFIGRARSRALA